MGLGPPQARERAQNGCKRKPVPFQGWVCGVPGAVEVVNFGPWPADHLTSVGAYPGQEYPFDGTPAHPQRRSDGEAARPAGSPGKV